MSENNENDRFEEVARYKSRAYFIVSCLSALLACWFVLFACWYAFPDAYVAQMSFLTAVLNLVLCAMSVGLHFRFKQRLEDRQRDARISTLEARVNDLEGKARD